MKTRLFLALFCASLLTTSCKEEKKSGEAPSKMEAVMAIHDEVMPQMGAIGKLVAALKPKVDSTENGQACAKAMKDLQQAHEAMMEWMQGFGEQFDSDEIINGKPLTKEKEQLLEEEAKKVKAVKEQINSSIARAEAILAKEG